ncbi:DNA-directed RNA polymerase III subunit RPC7-like isoform X2 [Dromaius novaehollandiae]|uniref:DNA-directed RNA polymerase III subunit RPC7-like isoform X2 n=1 Tax=Dromaius novaehollandiae TaxID=8790 RepID=UPI00311EA321
MRRRAQAPPLPNVVYRARRRGRTWRGGAQAHARRRPPPSSPRSAAGPRLRAPGGPAMAGRGGRGRGRGQMTFNVEAVGIAKGDALPPPTLQPSPLFPPLESRPAPLPGGEELEYMLALKQELRGAMKNLPYFVKPGAPRRDIERYSDKYQVSSPIDSAIDWSPEPGEEGGGSHLGGGREGRGGGRQRGGGGRVR